LTTGVFSFQPSSATLSLLGGYAANCQSRVVNPTNTVFDGQNAGNVGLFIPTQNDVTIEGISFTRMHKGVTLYFDDFSDGSGHEFKMRYNIFHDYQADGSDPNLSGAVAMHGAPDSGGVNVHFQNNLVYNVSATNGLPAVDLNSRDAGYIDMSNSTVAGIGSGIAAAVNFYAPNNGCAFLKNNIIFNGTSTSLSFSAGDIGPYAGYNLLGNVAASVDAGANSFVTNFNNSFGAPGFQNTSTHDYHLASNALLTVNAGGAAIYNPDGWPGHDLDGHVPRKIGSAIDLGAYESSVDDLNNFTVTSTLDASHASASSVNCAVNSSTCTLREAIIDANQNNGASRLGFNLPCASLLPLASALPDITTDVTIDGYTNPGATVNTSASAFNANLCIYLNGQGSVADGLHTSGSGRLTVRGLALGGFTVAAIRLDSGSGHMIYGNQIGNAFGSNFDGVHISGSSQHTTLGGYDDPAAFNLIGGNSSSGVNIDNTTGLNTVANNLIGLDSAGLSLPSSKNNTGVLISNSPSNTLNYNTISANTGPGISISGAGAKSNIVQYNSIGLATDGSPASNGDPAVLIVFAANGNTIGAAQSGTSGGNSLYSTAKGVWISTSGGAGNRVLANRITPGGSALGIDLGVAGATTNNSSGSANHMQNYPTVVNAFRTVTGEWIESTIDTTANATFRLDYYWGFCCTGGPGSPSRGIPNNYVGHGTTVITDSSGHAHIWTKLGIPTVGNQTLSLGLISATATASDGSTSEVGTYAQESSDMIFRDSFEVP